MFRKILLSLLVACAGLAGCAVNPVTGERNFQLYGSDWERQVGSQMYAPMKQSQGGDFTLFARLDCPTADDDSLWLKLDDGEFIQRNGLGTSGWQWITLEKFALTAGPHTITVGLREDGLKLDKLCLSTFFFAPEGMGSSAQNGCGP